MKSERERDDEVIRGLGRLLAETTVLSQKARGFHWNVTGPHFPDYHRLFGEQYEALSDAADELAERIRALGPEAPGSLGELLELSSIRDEHGAPPAGAMLRQLADDHGVAARTADAVRAAADAARDGVTADLMVRRMDAHQKAAWMLRASLAR